MAAALAVTFALAATARAQDFEAAGKHFSAAQEAFGAKHFKTAATEFEAAFSITKDPVLLYNVAESWEKAGDGHKAVASYKQYLKDQPNAQDRAEVQKRIAAIEAKHYRLVDQSAPGETLPPVKSPTPPPGATPPVATPTTPPALKEPGATPPAPSTSAAPPSPAPVAPPSTTPTTTETTPMTTPPPVVPTPQATTSQPAPPEPAAAPTPPPPPPTEAPPPGLLDEGPPSKLRVAAWIGVAATLAVLTAGAIFGLAAESRADEINRRLSFVDTNNQPHKFDQSAANDLQSLKDDGNLYNSLAIGFYSVAAAGAVATVTMFVVDAKRGKPEKKHAWRVSPVVGKNVGGFALGGSF